jgi:hypothetical protein
MSKIVVVILLLLGVSACSSAALPPTLTATPPPTVTVSSDELTAAVQFRATLPPTFTPTATMTATATPTATFTPTVTLTPSVVPESALCEQFAVAIDQPDEAVYRLRPVALQLYVRTNSVGIRFAVRDAQTEEVVLQFARPGGRLHLEVLLPFEFPQEGRYIWQATLFDAERNDMCPQGGVFIIDKTAASPTPEMTAEVTPELTPEVTEAP